MEREGGALRAMHVYVSGRVQGVGFRDFACREARRLGLVGYVRNLPDGRVEVWAEGPADQLQNLLAALSRGPRAASVTAVEHAFGEPRNRYSDFLIVY